MRWTLMLLLIAGCDDTGTVKDSGGGSAATDVSDVCARVFECGGWGWQSQAACESGFIGSAANDTVCVDEGGYFDCVPDCLDQGCDDFSTCEGDCWSASCD